MKNRNSPKLYILLTVCTAFIFSFSYIGNSVYGKVFNTSNAFTLNTQIGSVNISSMTPVEALGRITEEKKKWQEEAKISLQYKEKSLPLDLTIYEFQIEQSIESAQSGKENPLIVHLDEEDISGLLLEISPELTSDAFDFDQLNSDLLIYASRLEQGENIINLKSYFPSNNEDELIAESTAMLEGVDHAVNKWTSKLPMIEIEPHSQFSLLKILDENKLASLDQNTLSIISSSIYRTVLATNFDITERHISRKLPSFAEAGFEAKIDPEKNMDFIFTNPNDQKYSLQFKYLDSLLYISLKGSKFLYQYHVSVKDKETFAPKEIIQYDAKLPIGTEKKAKIGVEGIVVKVMREIKDESGMLLRSELISEDFYPPIHEVIIRSLTVKDKTPTTPDGPFENSDVTGNGEKEEDSVQNPTDDSQTEENEQVGSNKQAEESDLWGKPDETLK